MKYRVTGAIGLIFLLATIPRPTYAVTVDEVIDLAAAGASDSVIMAKIDEDGTVFHLTVGEILELKERNVSDVVITYMINTGKGQGEDAKVLTPEDETGPPEVTEDQGGGDYSVGLGFDSYGNVGVSFGYYYPHWPGYWYSYYYDPFWWPSWGWYWSYWQPYPYYHWYYDPWYACNGYYQGYYDHCYYDGYYNDGYYGYEDGRNVGNRGPSNNVDRVIKKPGDAAKAGSNIEQARKSTRMKDPGSDLYAERQSPSRNTIRRPETPGAGTTKVQRPERSRIRTPQYVRGTERGSKAAYGTRLRTQPGRNQNVTVHRSRPARGNETRYEHSAPNQGQVSAPSRASRGQGEQVTSRPSRSSQGQGGNRSYQGGGRSSFQGGGRSAPSMGSRGGGFSGGGGRGGGGGRSGKH